MSNYTHILRKSTPEREPLSLEEVKDHLRLDLDDYSEDIFLTELITTARTQCEEYCNRFFAEITALLVFPNSIAPVYLPPDSTITAITDDDGNAITAYTFDADTGRIKFENTHTTQIKVSCTTGLIYPAAKRAMVMLVADMYEQRTSDTQQRNLAVDALLTPLRWNLGV